MLTPEEIEGYRICVSRLVDPVVEYLLSDIAHRVRQAGKLTSTAAYETWRAEQLGLGRKELEQKLAELLGVSRMQARKLLRTAAQKGYDTTMARQKGHIISFEDNTPLQQIISSAVTLASDGLKNLTQTKAIGMMGPDGTYLPLHEAYRACTDFAFQQVITGAADYNTAIRQACSGIGKHGITVTYESGVRTTLEAAVRRNMMGGLGLMVEQIQQRNHDDLGCNGWEISAHANSAPDHEPIQGKQYPDAEFERLNNSLRRRIGTLNCGHVASPIILGVNSPQYTPDELEKFRTDNEKGVDYEGRHYTGYEAKQRQREIERSIRKQKRKLLLASPEDQENEAIKLQCLQQEYRRFSKGVGFRTEDERLEASGFGLKDQRKASAMAERHYQEWSKGIGANPPIKTLAKYYDVKYDDSPRYALLKQYAKGVEAGWISPLSGFENYEKLYNSIQNEIVGKTAADGTKISGQVPHFMQRVIGTAVDPEKLKNNLQIIRRSGVAVKDIQSAVFNPKEIGDIKVRISGQRSRKLIGENCVVTINPDTGMLIQTNQL